MNTPILSDTLKKIRAIIENTGETRLPSVRQLARQLGVSPVTILKAVRALKQEGIIEARWGKGNFIVDNKTRKTDADTYHPISISKAEKTVMAFKNDLIQGKYKTHMPLPSVKQLTSFYNVSYPTLKKALDLLCEENVIKRSGAGYCFFTARARPRTRIAVVAFGLGINSAKIVTERECNFYRLLSAVAVENNLDMEIICYNDYLKEPKFYTPDETKFGDYLQKREISGIILSSYHMKDSAECLRRLLRFNIPISAWVEDHRILKMMGRCGSARERLLFFDSSYSTLPGFEVGRYLIVKGHKNIAYISPFHKSPWSQNRLIGLKKAAASTPGARIHPFVSEKYLNDYSFLAEVIDEAYFEKHFNIKEITDKIRPFLKDRIYSLKYEHDILLRDDLIFTVCREFITKASEDESITAWVCANDHIAALITDYWNYSSVPIAKRPLLIGFDNSFKSFERHITSYEFNTYGEIRNMVDHLLYPNSYYLFNKNAPVRLSGRIIERGC